MANLQCLSHRRVALSDERILHFETLSALVPLVIEGDTFWVSIVFRYCCSLLRQVRMSMGNRLGCTG